MSKEVIDILKNGLKEAINEDCTLKLKIEGCKILLDYINQLETNIKDAIELMYDMDWNEWENGAEFRIQQILERGKE